MNRLVVLAVTVLISINANAVENMVGIFKCTTTLNKLITLDDGKPGTYAGWKDDIEIGDTLYINYKLFDFFGGENIKILLFKDGGDMPLSHNFWVKDKSKDPDEPWLVSIKDRSGVFRVNKDTLLSRNSENTLMLHRYYKNDWEGVYMTFSPTNMSSQIITLDCRHKEDIYEQYISYIASSDGISDDVTTIPRAEFDKQMEKQKQEAADTQ
tara:strand:- start:278 stop:910 length:633 start_codon:yes stop_codon:yes gene_type:complete